MCENMLDNGASQKDVSELLKSVVERLFGQDGKYWAEVYKKAHRKENPFEIGSELNLYRKDVKSLEKFYKKVFNETYDFSNVNIPICPGILGKDWWLVIVAKGMKPQRLFEKCRDKFGAWKWTEDNLDEIVTSDRTADNGHYAIWVRARVEADEEFKNLSANKLKEIKHKGITLEERLVIELFHFWKTKKHLDINNWTLCTGSRYSDGSVPACTGAATGSGVGWYDLGGVDDFLRSRGIVS